MFDKNKRPEYFVSYYLLNENKVFLELEEFQNLIDEKEDNTRIDMIKIGERLNIQNEILKVLIVNYLFGDFDGRLNNVAMTYDLRDGKRELYPSYDNEYAFFIDGEEFDEKELISQKRKNPSYISYLNTKYYEDKKELSKDENDVWSSFDIMNYIKDNYFKETSEFVKKIEETMDEEAVRRAPGKYKKLLNADKIEFFACVVSDRARLLGDLYEGKIERLEEEVSAEILGIQFYEEL